MSRIPKSKIEWEKQYESERARSSVDKLSSLTSFDSGEFIDVYCERTQVEFELFKKGYKNFKMITRKTGNKSGIISETSSESSEPLQAIYKLINRIYPKRDYLGRHVLKGSTVEDKKIHFIINSIASKDFEKKLKSGLMLIAKKYNLSYIFKSGPIE